MSEGVTPRIVWQLNHDVTPQERAGSAPLMTTYIVARIREPKGALTTDHSEAYIPGLNHQFDSASILQARAELITKIADATGDKRNHLRARLALLDEQLENLRRPYMDTGLTLEQWYAEYRRANNDSGPADPWMLQRARRATCGRPVPCPGLLGYIWPWAIHSGKRGHVTERFWGANHPDGYWYDDCGVARVIKPRHAKNGKPRGRRPFPYDPDVPSARYGIQGQTPRLPTIVACPVCDKLNAVFPPDGVTPCGGGDFIQIKPSP